MITKNKSEISDQKIVEYSLNNYQNWILVTELDYFNVYKCSETSLYWLVNGVVFGPYKTFKEAGRASMEE